MSVRSPSARMVGSAPSDSRHCATKRLGEAKALKLAHACDHRRPSVSLRGLIGSRPQVDDAIVPCGFSGKRAIKLGPAVRLDLGVQTATDFKVGSKPEFLGDQVPGPGAHPLADVVPRNHEVPAIVGHAAHDDVDVGVLGIPVIDSDPVELRTEISLGVSHQVPRERLQIQSRSASSGDTMNRKWWRSPAQRSANARSSVSSYSASNILPAVPSFVTPSRRR
jgi:hypothetical protein